jgi:putative aminopeptidase FrvX
MELLKHLCSIHAPSGNESALTEFLVRYINENKSVWKVQPEIHYGKGFQDCIVLVFGKPTTAVYAHIDSIGFTVKYGTELVKIGGPQTKSGYRLVGKDAEGEIECELVVDENSKCLSYNYHREIERGTTLTFKPDFRETEEFVQCCYLDNRMGVWVALQLAKTIENGVIAFSTYEEHGGGSAEFIGRFLYEKYQVTQALISDITWVTDGVHHHKGAAISMRDSGLPRRTYVNRIIQIAKQAQVPFQIEVESAGGSDGNALQRSPYPIDWCFIGAPEEHVHSPDEKVSKADLLGMLQLYEVLLKAL